MPFLTYYLVLHNSIIYLILYIYAMLCVMGMNDDVSMYGIYIYIYIYMLIYICIYQYGWTALIEASLNGHQEIVQLLLEHGADLQHQNKASHTPLPLPLPPPPLQPLQQ